MDDISATAIVEPRGFVACVFDLDGVVVNSEPIHALAKRHILDRHSISYPATIFDDFKGRTDVDFFDHVAELASDLDTEVLLAEKRDRYLALFSRVELVPGFENFFRMARRRFDRLGLATSATRRDVELVMTRNRFLRSVDVIVTSDDTDLTKPDPEPYRLAVERLAVAPSATLVIEDSPNGVRSAAAAGTYVVALATAFDPADLRRAGAHVVAPAFASIAEWLASLDRGG